MTAVQAPGRAPSDRRGRPTGHGAWLDVPPAGPVDPERRLPRFSPVWTVVPGAVLVALLAGSSVVVTPLAPFVVVLLAVLATATWRKPVIAAVVVAAFVPALSGLGRGAIVPGVKVSEVLLLAAAAVVFLRRPRGWRALTPVDLGLLLFTVVGAGFAALHGTAGGALTFDAMLRNAFFPAFLFLTWWTASRAVESREDVLVVLRWVLLLSLVPAVIGLLQYLDLPGVRATIVAVVGEGLMPLPGSSDNRITGPFPIAHSYGGYLIVPVVLSALLLLRGDRDVLRRRWLVLVLAVDMAAAVLAVTVTLFAWIPVAILVGAALTRRFGRAVGLLVVVGLVSAVLFAPAIADRVEQQTTATAVTDDGLLPQTLQYRILIWQRDYIPLMARAAAIGFGVDTPGSVLFAHTENQYVTLVLRGGVGLLLAAVLALGLIAVRALRQSRVPGGGEQAAAMTVFAILVFLPAAAMVWPYVTNAGLPQTIVGFAGAVLALDRTGRRLGLSRGETSAPGAAADGAPAAPGAAAGEDPADAVSSGWTPRAR